MVDNNIIRISQAAIHFTNAYSKYENSPIAIREAMCLKSIYPLILGEMEEDDLIAGSILDAPVGFMFSQNSKRSAFYCDTMMIENLLSEKGLPAGYKNQLKNVMSFWRGRTTPEVTRRRDPIVLPPAMAAAVTNWADSDGKVMIANYSNRNSGITLNFDKLIQTGIPGMMEEINEYKEKALAEGKETGIFEGMRICLDILVEACLYYAESAENLAKESTDSIRHDTFLEMASVLRGITVRKPGTFHEALQLIWIYKVLSGVENLGRMDVYLGDLYVQDLEKGIITKEHALELLVSLWKLIDKQICPFAGRIIIGGKGRKNEVNADRFALLAMEASMAVRNVVPQLTLRIYNGMNPILLDRALSNIGEGCVYHVLYNDDVLIPAIQKKFDTTEMEAQQYLPSDCGEYNLEHRTMNFANSSISLAKALEVTLHDGMDPVTGSPMGIRTGNLAGFDTFDKLMDAYRTQIQASLESVLDKAMGYYQVLEETSPFLFISMLLDDCVIKGQGMMAGARYRGTYIENYGNITVADSLTAIKKLVFTEKAMSLEKLVEVLDADFKGYEIERHQMQNAPKFGNDDETADEMVLEIQNHISSATKELVKRTSLQYVYADLVNADGNVLLGSQANATPDGRPAGKPFSNANNPTAGNDKNGVTATLNSMAKLDTTYFGGHEQNLKLSRELFSPSNIGRLKALLLTYFESGGPQLMITAVNRNDLESALSEPGKYSNLLVRVGGFCARYVELSREVQEDILARTLN